MAESDPQKPINDPTDPASPTPVPPQSTPDNPEPPAAKAESPAPLAAQISPAIPEPVIPPTLPEPVNPAPPPVKQGVARVPQKAPASKDPLSKFRNKNVADDDGAPMSFIDHLMELRKRMWVCIVSCMVFIILGIVFYNRVYNVMVGPVNVINDWLAGPAGDVYRNDHRLIEGVPAIKLSAMNPLANMLLIIWLGFWGGIVVAAPVMLYQMWAFIAPGLRPVEKKAILPVLYGGLGFFLGGVFVCYKWMIPPTLQFFVTLDLDLHNQIVWTSETTIDLMLWMMIISGLLCEIPLIIAAMAKMDIICGSSLTKHWRGMIFGSILIGAIVSPGNDLASMGVFSGLMLGIYFVSIVMAYLFQQKPPKKKDDKKKQDDKKA